MKPANLLPVIALCAVAGTAKAAINIPTDGSDGAFSPTSSTVVDLSQAVTGTWSDPNTANAGKGIYDPNKWAVVYKYSSVNIPSGVTVTFKNHPSKAPVVWLVNGNVTISGTGMVNLNGADTITDDLTTEPGPGGFRGGARGSQYSVAGTGFGPGAGNTYSSYGTKGTTSSGPVYGNVQILPLIGGSGGGGYVTTGSGGAGAGAILIAATGSITVGGYIYAVGGSALYGGTGGSIRLLADSITITRVNALYAPGSNGGGNGRIRLEANQFSLITITPAPSTAPPIFPNPVIFPDNPPKVSITSVDTIPVSPDPTPDFVPTNATLVNIAKTTAVNVHIAATNIPSTWTVTVRAAPKNGGEVVATATKFSGDDVSSVWTADIVMPLGYNALQVRAVKP